MTPTHVRNARPAAARRPRPTTMAAALAVTAVLVLGACLAPDQQSALDALNASRRSNGRGALVTQADAQAKAQAWAERLARENRLYHSNLTDGIRVKWCSLAENVGYGPSIQAVQNGFMNSPDHRKNVLGSFNGVGVGVAHRGKTVFVVHVFIRTC